jgi:hypothetical protein
MFMQLVYNHPAFKDLPEVFDLIADSIEAVQFMPE